MPPFFQRLRAAALERLRHFDLLDHPVPFTFREGWEGMLPGLDDDHLFLDTYEERMLLERFAHYGITGGLAARGFQAYRLRLNTADHAFQHLQVFSDDPSCAAPLAEITLHRGNFATRAPFAEPLHGLVLPMLFIHWIRLQDPRTTAFDPARPRMPGQEHPGLGLGNKVMHMLAMLGEKLGTEGLANSPEYPHNAVLYSKRFTFVDPSAEGRLHALTRDLAPHGLADASWGIVLGCVREERSGEPFAWSIEEQVLPIGKVFAQYFGSRAYRNAAKDASEQVRYVLDAERLASLPRVVPPRGAVTLSAP